MGLGTMVRVGDRGMGFVGSSVGGHPIGLTKFKVTADLPHADDAGSASAVNW
jgi:hypothetical protein